LEVDRRRSRERISKLKDELKEVHGHRELYRQKRRRAGIPVVALVGYTNAGKSTLLNALSNAQVLAANVLFATLDPTTRQLQLPDGQGVLMTDTVGFIQRLPTQPVAAFRATLEEIQDADVLLHVVDITHPNAEEQSQTVESVLSDLGVADKPRFTALNKIDRLFSGADRAGIAPPDGAGDAEKPEPDWSAQVAADLKLGPGYVPVSAERGWGLDALLEQVQGALSASWQPVSVVIPYSQSDLVALFHEKGIIQREEHTGGGTHIVGRIPKRFAGEYRQFSA